MTSAILLVICAPLLLIMSLTPLSELLALLRRATPEDGAVPTDPEKLLFLIPAHNEELLITACVRSLLDLNYPEKARSVVVVADNCSDRTAELARKAGARCLERSDPENPGKPHALAWALAQLPIDGWDACVVIDADTTVDPGFGWALSGKAPLREKCVQAYFDVSNPDESWLTLLAGVLAKVRYEGSYPLKRSAGLNAPLTGNGMCIGTSLLAREGWPAFSLTENWELYAKYTAEGVAIEYARAARLYSEEAGSLTQAGTQRKRWLAGRAWVLYHYGPLLLRSRNAGAHQKLDALGELASPSPVLHSILVAFVATLALVAIPTPLGWLLATAAGLTLLPLCSHTFLALRGHPHRWKILGSFLFLPAYALWRVLTAVRTVGTLREGRWVKTERA